MKHMSLETKFKIIDEYNNCKSPAIIKGKYGVSKATLYNWIEVLTVKKAGMYSSKQYSAWDIHLMERELRSLREENQIFRESECSVISPVKDKIAAVEKLKGKFSIYAICRTLNLSKGTYYHRNKYRPEKTIYQEKDEQLRPLIKKFFEESKERFGASKIKIALDNIGISVSKKHIERLMKEMELVCKQTRIRCTWATKVSKFRRNRLKQNFTQDTPNTYWVSDITYVPIENHDNLYGICVVIDLFSRKVLSFQVSEFSNTDMVWKTFDKAFNLRGCPENLTFHSDQGIQYTAYKFRKHLRDLGIRQSFSNPGSPLDNAVAEAFFSIMKREELSHNFYKSKEHLEAVVAEYIDFFNNARPHRKLKNMTPNQYELNYHQNLQMREDENEKMAFIKDILSSDAA